MSTADNKHFYSLPSKKGRTRASTVADTSAKDQSNGSMKFKSRKPSLIKSTFTTQTSLERGVISHLLTNNVAQVPPPVDPSTRDESPPDFANLIRKREEKYILDHQAIRNGPWSVQMDIRPSLHKAEEFDKIIQDPQKRSKIVNSILFFPFFFWNFFLEFFFNFYQGNFFFQASCYYLFFNFFS